MPACSCPRCHTQIWVKDEQLKIAQGFVVCTKCEGLFKATENIVDLKGKFQPEVLPTAMTDLRLSRGGKMPVQSQKQLSRNEIADLFDSFTVAPKPVAAAAAPAAERKNDTNWTLATLVALTVLIIQLFYLVLLL